MCAYFCLSTILAKEWDIPNPFFSKYRMALYFAIFCFSRICLFCNGADEKWKSITFRGFIRPDDFVRSSIGHFGLVWDGSSIDECTGDWGEYLRINNPHKTSFYIRSGKPVIMWEKSALTPFVLREGVGIAVNSLREIGDKLKSITPEQYYGLCQRAAAVSKHLSSGHYFREAYRKALLLL